MPADPNLTKVNRSINARTNKGKNVQASGNLIYNHNFASRPGRSFSVQAQYSFSNNRQKSTTWSDIIYYLLKEEDGNDDNEPALPLYRQPFMVEQRAGTHLMV